MAKKMAKKSTKQSSSKLKLGVLIGAIVLIVVATALALYFMVLRQPSPTEAYREAVTNALMTKENDAYISLDIQADGFSLTGQANADINNENGMMQYDFEVDTGNGGASMDIKGEAIAITKNSKQQNFMRYKSVTTDSSEYKEMIEAYFAPVLNKWAKIDITEDDKTDGNFADRGPTAILIAYGLFMPISNYTEAQKDTYLKMLDKYNLYSVSKEYEKTTFRGVDARKIRVDIKKDAFAEFDKEMAQAINDEKKYEKTDSTFINELFGVSGQISADVYLDPKESKIIGIELSVDLKDKIVDKAFNNEFDSVTASAYIEYGRKFTVDAPKNYLSEGQFQALLGQ